MADTIQTLLRARRMGANGRELVRRKCVWPIIAERIAAVYERAIDGWSTKPEHTGEADCAWERRGPPTPPLLSS